MGAIHARGVRDNITGISGLERSRNEMRTGQPKNRLGEPKRLKRTYEDQCDVLYQDLVTARKSNVNHHLSMWSPKNMIITVLNLRYHLVVSGREQELLFITLGLLVRSSKPILLRFSNYASLVEVLNLEDKQAT